MKTSAIVVAVLVGSAGAALLAAERSTADATSARVTLTFVSTEARWTYVVDRGPEGDSPGDEWFFQDVLVNAKPQLGLRRGAAAGHSEGSIRTLGRGIEDGVWTAFLPNGTIVVDGAYRAAAAKQVQPVVGGTGDYARAEGVAAVVDGPGGSTLNVFDLRLPTDGD